MTNGFVLLCYAVFNANSGQRFFLYDCNGHIGQRGNYLAAHIARCELRIFNHSGNDVALDDCAWRKLQNEFLYDV